MKHQRFYLLVKPKIIQLRSRIIFGETKQTYANRLNNWTFHVMPLFHFTFDVTKKALRIESPRASDGRLNKLVTELVANKY